MNTNQILKQQIELIKPGKDTLEAIKKTAKEFTTNLQSKLKNKKIRADVFIGGSLAKETLLKKKKYDVDVFVRFDEKYEDDKISNLLGKLLNKAKRVHGSRDYYKTLIKGIIFEVIPVIKIKNQKEARNITDLSYFHVKYIKDKLIKNKKFADEILLAKTFTHAQNCYGAESYIHGFSGYSLELLICHYGSFLNFIKNAVKAGNEKIIIDDKKFYKDKNEILRELNESKIQSPIILIDPTFKNRNALAGLSEDTFNKFRENCKAFLKNSSSSFFEKKEIFEELKKKYKNDLKIVKIKTGKQRGDIAGSKSKKFFNFFCQMLEKEFKIKLKEFEYDEDENLAYFYLAINKKEDEIIKGPPADNANNLSRFKKAHKNAFIKNNFAHAKIKHSLSLEKFLEMFRKKYKKIIKEMSVEKMNLIE
ncbi:MAG: nucleotidyltransferase domain-containing protein [Nanoarchaeota archaeon]|nr:nucleotidyltransferase domain-containing protein [Nanoarchaeota archaeon]